MKHVNVHRNNKQFAVRSQKKCLSNCSNGLVWFVNALATTTVYNSELACVDYTTASITTSVHNDDHRTAVNLNKSEVYIVKGLRDE